MLHKTTLTTAVNCRFTVHHVLSAADAGWPGLTGLLRDEIFDRFIPASYVDSTADTLLCVCGPTPFTQEFLRSVGLSRSTLIRSHGSHHASPGKFLKVLEILESSGIYFPLFSVAWNRGVATGVYRYVYPKKEKKSAYLKKIMWLFFCDPGQI